VRAERSNASSSRSCRISISRCGLWATMNSRLRSCSGSMTVRWLLAFVERTQLQDVVLQLVQQAVGAGRGEQVDPLIAGGESLEIGFVAVPLVLLVEQADIVASLFAPGRKQRMAVEMEPALVEVLGHLACRLTPVGMAEQIPPFDDIAPIMPAWIEHEQHHLAHGRDRLQRLQHLARQRGETEDDDPARQLDRTQGRDPRRVRVLTGPGTLQKDPMDLGAAGMTQRRIVRAMLGVHVGLERTPQHRLPVLTHGNRPPLAVRADQDITPLTPGLQPVGPIDLILIEQVREPFGKLIAPARGGLLAIDREKAAQRVERIEAGVARLERRHPCEPFEQTIQPPGQRGLVEGRGLGQIAKHGAVDAPDETRRQHHVQCGGDSLTTRDGFAVIMRRRCGGQGQLEPLGNAVALYQDRLVLQRCERMTAHPGHQQSTQLLQPIALDQHEAGWPIGDGRQVFRGHGSILCVLISTVDLESSHTEAVENSVFAVHHHTKRNRYCVPSGWIWRVPTRSRVHSACS
jgi:hypothetical protein